MTKQEAEEIIKQYNLNPPQPFKYYYRDPYDDGKFCCSGWHYEYPPMDPKLIDAILERDKDCKEYIPDCDCEVDEKFNQEMEKRFTDLMSRAKEHKSSNQELISNLCDDIKENVENLYNIIEANYLQRINNYISKEQSGSKNNE